MNSKRKKLHYILITAAALLLIVVAVWFNFVFILAPSEIEGVSIGMIDFDICGSYENIICNVDEKSEVLTHGDFMLDFLDKNNFEGTVYYFDASDSTGKISTKRIIEGLEWMDENDVKSVSISLSSSYYDAEFEKWLEEHQHMSIYASYNNRENSSDYPAMYASVIASGKRSDIQYKDNDRIYRSNKIVVLNKGVYYYEGNSFLAIRSMLDSFLSF